MFLDCFDLKNKIFLKKKYFNTFLNKKYFYYNLILILFLMLEVF